MTLITWVLVALNTFMAILLGLKVWDGVRAFFYNRKRAHREAIQAAYNQGFRDAVGAYARAKSYKVVPATPDRPVSKLQYEIDSITSRNEAVNYPKGS